MESPCQMPARVNLGTACTLHARVYSLFLIRFACQGFLYEYCERFILFQFTLFCLDRDAMPTQSTCCQLCVAFEQGPMQILRPSSDPRETKPSIMTGIFHACITFCFPQSVYPTQIADAHCGLLQSGFSSRFRSATMPSIPRHRHLFCACSLLLRFPS